MIMWHQSVWEATVNHARARKLNLAKHDLKALWAGAYRRRPVVKTWAKVAGPATAVRKTAKRIGWRAMGPFRWRNDEGIDFMLDKISPKLLRILPRPFRLPLPQECS